MSEIIAYASSTRPNHLWSAAQVNSALPKNRVDADIPLVSASAFNIFKAKAISRGKLLDRFRNVMIEVKDGITDEGDRVFFGSSNDADMLKDVIQEMDELRWDRIISERPEIDPYEQCRKHRALIETLVKALEDATAYDDFLRTFTGPALFTSGDNAALDASYDKWEKSARAALAAAKKEGF